MARRTTSRSTASQKKRPYRKAPKSRRRKGKRRNRFDSLLPTSERAMATTMTVVERVHLPQLSRPSIDWLRWSGWHWSKLTGLLVACLALAGIIWIHMDYHWFVYADTVEFEALTYLTPEELFPADELEGWSIFWIESEQIRQHVSAHPYVADADVSIHLPNQVLIEVEEESPTAIWVTDTGPKWVLDDGSALDIRTTPNLPVEAQLLDENGRMLPTIVDVQRGAASVRAMHEAVDPGILESALALVETIPGLSDIRYNRGVGLNFGLPGTNYWVYWGDGSDLAEKQENLTLSLAMLEAGEVDGQVIDVRFVEHPIIR